jgi:hypothetical protein
VVEKKGDTIHFDFSGSADQTKGPANVRPPLVKAAVGYALISLVDPLDLHQLPASCARSRSRRAKAACSIRNSLLR